MNREQLTLNIKLYSLISLAKCCELLGNIARWTNAQLTAADIWLTAKSTKYRR